MGTENKTLSQMSRPELLDELNSAQRSLRMAKHRLSCSRKDFKHKSIETYVLAQSASSNADDDLASVYFYRAKIETIHTELSNRRNDYLRVFMRVAKSLLPEEKYLEIRDEALKRNGHSGEESEIAKHDL